MLDERLEELEVAAINRMVAAKDGDVVYQAEAATVRTLRLIRNYPTVEADDIGRTLEDMPDE